MSKYSIDQFLKCCEASGPVQLVIEHDGDQTETSYIFQQPFALIGSHDRASARLTHPQVSIRQLYLQVIGGRLYAVSLSPRTPVRWGGEKRGSGWVGPDDTLTFGPYRLRVTGGIAPVGPNPSNPLRHSSTSGPTVTLEMTRDDEPPVFGVLDRDLSLVGSTSICRVRLHDPRISTVHCSLVRTRAGYWVVDLGGRGGVRVNDVVVTVALLEDGDRIGLDGHTIRVGYDRTPAERVATSLRTNEEQVFADQAKTLGPQDTLLLPDDISPEGALGPILDRFAEFQNQTFEQFQGVLRSMAQTFASMLGEQREFMREELNRLERLVLERERHPTSNPSLPAAEIGGDDILPVPHGVVPSPEPLPADRVPDSQFHVWFEEQLNTLHTRRVSTWQRLFGSNGSSTVADSPRGK